MRSDDDDRNNDGNVNHVCSRLAVGNDNILAEPCVAKSPGNGIKSGTRGPSEPKGEMGLL